MVKSLHLGLFAAIVCLCAAGFSSALPVVTKQLLSDDGAVRSERSTNLSHITGSLRKIQMYVKNWHLQILPDGVINGTSEDTSDYTILQRTTVNIGQVKIQGVATCQYLCMDSCGLLYGAKEFNDECVFSEMIEQHNYNTYSSARYSNLRRTMYLALNRRGQPRKVQVRAKQQLGKLSTYARVLTKWVSVERVEALLSRLHHEHPLRHHGAGAHMCASTPGSTTPPPDPASGDRLRCRKRKKRKKKRRKCPIDGSGTEPCIKRKKPVTAKTKKLCEQDSSRKICQRIAKSELVTLNKNKKKNKQKVNAKKKTIRGNKKPVNKVLATLATSSAETTTVREEEYSYSSMAYDLATTESSEDSGSVAEDSEQVYDELEAMTSTAPPGAETD